MYINYRNSRKNFKVATKKIFWNTTFPLLKKCLDQLSSQQEGVFFFWGGLFGSSLGEASSTELAHVMGTS